MTAVFDAASAPVTLAPLPAEKCPQGQVRAGVDLLAHTEVFEVGVWEHEAGVSTDVEVDEVFVVLSGRGRILLEDGTELPLAPGTVGVLDAGERTTWEIDEPLRKVWLVER